MGLGKVIAIVLLVAIIIAIIAFLIYFFVFRKRDPTSGTNGGNGGNDSNGSSTKPEDLTYPGSFRYGDIIRLQNQYNQYYLSSCETFTDCGHYNATLRTDNETVGARKWKITSDTKKTGEMVLYGDKVQLINQYTVYQGKLGSCGDASEGDNCGANVVVGRTTPDTPSETWTIEGKTTGTYVRKEDVIKLKNNWNNIHLSSCGHYEAGGLCGVNVSLRTDTPAAGSQDWKIICSEGTCTTK